MGLGSSQGGQPGDQGPGCCQSGEMKGLEIKQFWEGFRSVQKIAGVCLCWRTRKVAKHLHRAQSCLLFPIVV